MAVAAWSDTAQTDIPQKTNLRLDGHILYWEAEPAMNTRMRLYVDGFGKGWAIVRCNACTDVDKYSALDAFDAPVVCKCGQSSDVRDVLMVAVREWPTPSLIMFDVLRFLPNVRRLTGQA